MSHQQSVKSLISKLKKSQHCEQLFDGCFIDLYNDELKESVTMEDLQPILYKQTFKKTYLLWPEPIEYKSNKPVWKETIEWIQVLGETSGNEATREFITGLYLSRIAKSVWLFDGSSNIIKGMCQSRRTPVIYATNTNCNYTTDVNPINSLLKNNNLTDGNVLRSISNYDKAIDMIFVDHVNLNNYYSILWLFIKMQIPHMLLRISEEGTTTMFILFCWLLFDSVQLFRAPWSGSIYLSVKNKKQPVAIQTGIFKYLESYATNSTINILPEYIINDPSILQILEHIKNNFAKLADCTEDEKIYIEKLVYWVKSA